MRIIAATNKNLKDEVEASNFRGDLLFRLRVVHIELPPLRERHSDIPLLVAHFLEKYAAKLNRTITDVDPEVMKAFFNYQWPGNVRELEHVVERGLVLCNGHSLTLKDLPAEVKECGAKSVSREGMISGDKSLAETLDEIEEQIIKDALRRTGNIQAQAAKSLGISRSNLQYKMKKYGLM